MWEEYSTHRGKDGWTWPGTSVRAQMSRVGDRDQAPLDTDHEKHNSPSIHHRGWRQRGSLSKTSSGRHGAGNAVPTTYRRILPPTSAPTHTHRTQTHARTLIHTYPRPLPSLADIGADVGLCLKSRRDPILRVLAPVARRARFRCWRR